MINPGRMILALQQNIGKAVVGKEEAIEYALIALLCKGHVLIAGHKAPIVGKVCMDMCFVDVTGIDCAEGDRAVFFGEGDLLESNAAAAGTITYELLTNVSPRVRRIYIQE